jgi:hypothetical protein
MFTVHVARMEKPLTWIRDHAWRLDLWRHHFLLGIAIWNCNWQWSHFIPTLKYLSKCYHINHIWISGYNSHTNSIVEQTHFDVQQLLFKAINRDQAKWSTSAHSVFWAEHITVWECMGCLPYFTVTGSHPLIPLNISEATYLQPPPDAILLTTDLFTHCARRDLWT